MPPKLSSQLWLKRQARDPFVRQRDEQGFASRAAFKLAALDAKYGLLKARGGGAPKVVLDLGAAPGGWTQVALRAGALVTSVDLLPHSITGPEAARVRWIQGDFDDAAVQAQVAALTYDVVLSDMAPSYSGHDDHVRLIGLAECAFRFAQSHLKPGGALLCKISRGGEENSFRDLLKTAFASVAFVKPPASRQDSSEMFILARDFKSRA